MVEKFFAVHHHVHEPKVKQQTTLELSWQKGRIYDCPVEESGMKVLVKSW